MFERRKFINSDEVTKSNTQESSAYPEQFTKVALAAIYT
jgi:hypothetical protein